MKILVTGGAGFIGSHIAEAYSHAGYQVGVVDIKDKDKLPFNSKKIIYFQCDITTPKIKNIFAKFEPEVISHHAALINVNDSMKRPAYYGKTNVIGTLQLLRLSKKHRVKHFIFASSVAVYGKTAILPIKESHALKPISVYGLDKYIGEKYSKLYNQEFKTTIFRYSNVYGPRQIGSAEGGVVAIFARKMCSKKTQNDNDHGITIYGNGKQTRDFIYVKDVARANLQAVENKNTGSINLSTNRGTSINTLYATMEKIIGRQKKVIYKKARKGDVLHSVLSNKLAKKTIGWSPEYDLKKGLKETIVWFRK